MFQNPRKRHRERREKLRVFDIDSVWCTSTVDIVNETRLFILMYVCVPVQQQNLLRLRELVHNMLAVNSSGA